MHCSIGKMKCKAVILFIYSAVSLAQNTGSNGDLEDRWSWGYVDETNKDKKEDLQSTTTTSTTTTTTDTNYDPCAFYNPPKPSFKAPGRRINEEKCEEYIYDIKLVEEQIRRTTECIAINNKDKPNQFYPAAVGGRPALQGEFPHMGAIGWKAVSGGYIFKCGSTLISPKFVMTAAHCIRAPPDTSIDDPDPKMVRLNDQNLFFDADGNQTSISSDVNISRIIVHPDYHPPKKYFDIALMELARTVKFTYKLRPACLWNSPGTGDFGKEVSLTGWGVLAQGSVDISPHLQAANVDIIDSEQCEDLLVNSRNRHWWGLTEDQLCAGRLEGGVDACQGDSGGPLQFRKPLYNSQHGNLYYVIGITSFGIGCALPKHPGIYTRVYSFIDWIEQNVWK